MRAGHGLVIMSDGEAQVVYVSPAAHNFIMAIELTQKLGTIFSCMTTTKDESPHSRAKLISYMIGM
jgi:hypothetical protein